MNDTVPVTRALCILREENMISTHSVEDVNVILSNSYYVNIVVPTRTSRLYGYLLFLEAVLFSQCIGTYIHNYNF